MNTLTPTRPQRVSASATTQSFQRPGVNPVLFEVVAVGALIAAAVGIYLTGTMNLCTSAGPAVLMVVWFLLPVTSIASIGGAAISTRRSADRYLAASIAAAMTAMWLFALVWAQVGDAIDQVAC